jgi:dTDP-4-amino-4,6-dideoxygalactose transaminase
VLTNSDEIARRVKALRNYGSEVKYHHPEMGFNSRLDPIQAVVLSVKLKRLQQWNEARRMAAHRYDELLASEDFGVSIPKVLQGNEHVFHLYVVRVPGRDEVLQYLHAHGIGAAIHYPVPLHLQGAFSYLGHGVGDFPNAERAAEQIISLPLFPEITPDQQMRVADALHSALSS